MEWTNDLVLKLIEEYRIRPILWDSTNKYFKIKSKKEDAWSEISEEMNISNFEIKKKMISLLASFRRERQKVEHKPSGSSADEVYKTKWFAFKSFLFLLNKNKPNDTEDTEEMAQLEEESITVYDTDELTDVQEDTEQNISPSGNFPFSKGPPRKKRKKDEDDVMLMDAYKVLKSITGEKQKRDGCAIYGEYIVDKLRSYDKRTLSIVQHKFNNILFSADMGHFAENTQVKAPVPSSVCSVHSCGDVYDTIELVKTEHSASEDNYE